MTEVTQKPPKDINENSICINSEFIKELFIALSVFIENIKDIEKMFSELANTLNMNHINLYRILSDWKYETICSYIWKWKKPVSNDIIKKNINLYIAAKNWKSSAIPMPHFWDNIVIPIWMDDLYLAAWDSKNSRDIVKIENSLFELVAWVIANALRSMKLIEQANTDKLTWLLNRNALDKYIYEWKNPFDRKLSYPKAICMLDIDHFKKFNDTFWHNVWDKVLRHVADLCKQYFWEDNKVYRFWWEEMTFIIHEEKTGDLLKYIDWIRKKISETELVYEWISYQVNASIGVYELKEDDIKKKDSKFFAIKHADKALYEAKESWRNKVCISDRRWV